MKTGTTAEYLDAAERAAFSAMRKSSLNHRRAVFFLSEVVSVVQEKVVVFEICASHQKVESTIHATVLYS